MPWLAVCAVLFLVCARIRRAMLCTAFVLGPGGPIGEYWAVQDYWRPDYLLRISIGTWTFGPEDVVWFGPISAFFAAVFELVAGRKNKPRDSSRLAICLVRMCTWCLVALALMAVASAVMRINSIWAAVLSTSVLSAVILSRMPDLLRPVIVAAILSGLALWVCYAGFWFLVYPGLVRAWWHDDAIVMLLPGGVPLTEVIWAVAAAAFIGPLYRLSSSGLPNSTASANEHGAPDPQPNNNH